MSPIKLNTFDKASGKLANYLNEPSLSHRITLDNKNPTGLKIHTSPRNWKTRVVGWLKNLPVVRNFGSVRKERAENKAVMRSFIRALRHDHGDDIGRMAAKHLSPNSHKALSARRLSRALYKLDRALNTDEPDPFPNKPNFHARAAHRVRTHFKRGEYRSFIGKR